MKHGCRSKIQHQRDDGEPEQVNAFHFWWVTPPIYRFNKSKHRDTGQHRRLDESREHFKAAVSPGAMFVGRPPHENPGNKGNKQAKRVGERVNDVDKERQTPRHKRADSLHQNDAKHESECDGELFSQV